MSGARGCIETSFSLDSKLVPALLLRLYYNWKQLISDSGFECIELKQDFESVLARHNMREQ